MVDVIIDLDEIGSETPLVLTVPAVVVSSNLYLVAGGEDVPILLANSYTASTSVGIGRTVNVVSNSLFTNTYSVSITTTSNPLPEPIPLITPGLTLVEAVSSVQFHEQFTLSYRKDYTRQEVINQLRTENWDLTSPRVNDSARYWSNEVLTNLNKQTSKEILNGLVNRYAFKPRKVEPRNTTFGDFTVRS